MTSSNLPISTCIVIGIHGSLAYNTFSFFLQLSLFLKIAKVSKTQNIAAMVWFQ